MFENKVHFFSFSSKKKKSIFFPNQFSLYNRHGEIRNVLYANSYEKSQSQQYLNYSLK